MDLGHAQPVAGSGQMSEGTPGAEGDEVGVAWRENEPIEHSFFTVGS